MRDLERLLGRKTMETEILKGSPGGGSGKKVDLAHALVAAGRFPVKRISEVLGVARSNLIERKAGRHCGRPSRSRIADDER